MTVSNLKASISEKTNLPEHEFKVKWGKKYISGNSKLEELGIKDGDVLEIKLDLNGGQDYYQIQSRVTWYEEDRRGGILLKTSGVTNGNPCESGTSAIIYHRGNKIIIIIN